MELLRFRLRVCLLPACSHVNNETERLRFTALNKMLESMILYACRQRAKRAPQQQRM